jgi:hypothetical protein
MRSLSFLLVLAACGKGDDEETFDFSQIDDGPLEGIIGGQPWAFDSAATDGFLSDEDGFFTTFSSTPISCDGYGSGGGGDQLISFLPLEPAEVTLSLSDSVTFFVEATFENLVATSGGIRIDSVTDDTIEGALYATFDGDNEVNGTFTVAICPAVDF